MISTSRSLNTTTRCHSVRSLRSPLVLSFQLSEVATDILATRVPSLVERISGSRPRLPIRITLLTLPAIAQLPFLACLAVGAPPAHLWAAPALLGKHLKPRTQ